jgi:hypothetical protein
MREVFWCTFYVPLRIRFLCSSEPLGSGETAMAEVRSRSAGAKSNKGRGTFHRSVGTATATPIQQRAGLAQASLNEPHQHTAMCVTQTKD